MADWELSFRESTPLTVDVSRQAMCSIASGPVSTSFGAISGDPREGYSRIARITAPCGDAHLELALMQFLHSDDPDSAAAGSRLVDATLRGPTAPKLAAWRRMREAFAPLGCVDATLTWRPAAIVDEIEASGDIAAAARLRADITGALIAKTTESPYGLTLMSTRADIDAVLAACDAERLTMILLTDCRLSGLPAGIARFARLEELSVTDDAVDGRAFRGVSLPKLTRLHVGGAGLRRLSREDVAGLPSLGELVVFGTPLEDLDPAIVEACPHLRRVQLGDTPLARDPEKLAALQARMPAASVES